MKVTSISRKLLARVLSTYFILTFIVTCGQIAAEYFNTKSHITSELLTLEKTFSGGLTRAVWELNSPQIIDTAEGLVAIPMIKGITIIDDNNKLIAQMGTGSMLTSIDYLSSDVQDNSSEYQNIDSFSQGLFGHTFPLIFEFSGRTIQVGTVTLLSSNEVIFNRIEVGIYFLIGNAMVKTAALIFLFSLAFSKLLTNPLNELTEQMNQLDLEDPEASKLETMNYEQNELSILEASYNNLIDELVMFKDKYAQAQNEIVAANNRLDDQNLQLEQEVAKKTSSLSTTMLKMELQQRDMLQQQDQMKEENTRRKKTELTLIQTNKDLQTLIVKLNRAKERLLQAEKMASLGSLSAEVSHEINTPIGVSITSTSYLADLLTKIERDISGQTLTKRSINDFITNARQSVDMIGNNLSRASELNTSYKQVAVDQLSDKIRIVNIAKYIDEIIQSLHPKLKKTNHKITINCPQELEIYCHAGALSQIFTNLIINSVLHGFENINRGEITITVEFHDEQLHIHYEDNGLGLSEEKMAHLYEPFYTTKASQGGTGLGTHIIQTLVTDTLNGTLDAYSKPNEGLSYDIKFNNMR